MLGVNSESEAIYWIRGRYHAEIGYFAVILIE